MQQNGKIKTAETAGRRISNTMARIVIQQGAVAAHIRQCGSPSTLRYIRRIRAVPSIGTNRAAIILTLTKIWSLGNIEFSVVIADPGPAR